MPKPSRPTRRRPVSLEPLKSLAVHSCAGPSVRVHNPSLIAEISVLAPDLFRIRVSRGAQLSPVASWAVVPHLPLGVPAEVITRAGKVTVRTEQGQLRLDLKSGAWRLEDRSGVAVFESPTESTGFAATEARVTLALADNESIFGVGESSGTFNKRGLIRDFWNIDVGGHSRTVYAGLRHLYVSVPFALSLRHGRAAGIFWDNPSRQSWDIGQTEFTRWKLSASVGEIDLYLFLGPTCEAVLSRFTDLTGRMPLPPLWALGYQQCRYSYETQARVEEVARTFRRRKIPCDVLYLDIHYMDGYRVFTFGTRFPHPEKMLARLRAQGFHVVAIVDPGVKDDPRFAVLRRGLKHDAFVKAADGKKDYLGEVWPGRVRFPDFLNPPARAWWGEEQGRFQARGIAGFWNDMNEPADFSAPGKDFPGRCVHRTAKGHRPHAAVHNVYGSEMARASYEGALAHAPNQRPFVITRAGYAGLQRHAVVWTGDNDSSWEHLADSVQMLLNLGLSGVPFCGADVGGFHHNATGELLVRWTQLAAFTPFFRNHSNIGTIDQEPWAFGPEVERICQRYIELRYQLLPYFYGLFRQAHRQGTPIIRPLLWHYPNDPLAVAAGDQFLLGADLLVAPVLRQGAAARSVYLPSGTWFDFWTGERFRGGRHILAEAPLVQLPLYVRAGAILPLGPVQQYVGQRPVDVINLHIWPGTRGELGWYEDDGLSLDYKAAAFSDRRIYHSIRNGTTRLQFDAPVGAFPSTVKTWRVILRAVARPIRPKLGKTPIQALFHSGQKICVFEVPNPSDRVEVSWRALSEERG